MIIVRVGAGPGDPDLVAARAVEVLAEAAVVVCPAALVGLARGLARPGTPVLGPDRLEEASAVAGGGLVVHLVPGDGVDPGPLSDQTTPTAGPAADLAVGPAARDRPAGVGGDPAGDRDQGGVGSAAVVLEGAVGGGVGPVGDLVSGGRAGGLAPSSRRAAWPAPTDIVPGPAADVGRRALTALADVGAARPLRGLSVVVTRAATQAADLSRPLRRRGAEVIELATIRIDPPDDGGRALQAALDRIETYRWLVLTSVNGARAVLDRLPDGRRLAGVRLAAIGPATAAALADAHLPADLVPPRFVAESLLEVFPAGTGRVLLARAAVARDTLPAGLDDLGWQVDVVPAYRTATPELPPGLLDDVSAADVACFTAPSTFEKFCALAGPDRLPRHLACIGPVTAAAVRRAGREPAVEAEVHTMAGLVDALTAWARTR